MAYDDHIILVTEEQKNAIWGQEPSMKEIHRAKVVAADKIEKAMLEFVKETGLQITNVRTRYRFSEWTIGPPLQVGSKLSCDVVLTVEI